MRFTYLAVLAACLVGTAPLELFLHARVYARWRRWLLAITPGFLAFLAWDLYATSHSQWFFDPRQTVGISFPGGLPLEEVLFFVVIPTCALLAFEAVRALTGWRVDDE